MKSISSLAVTACASFVVFDKPVRTRAIERRFDCTDKQQRFRSMQPLFPHRHSLPSHRAATTTSQGTLRSASRSKIAVPALTVTSSLAVVLGLFAGLVWLTRKFGSRSMNQGAVPKEVLSSLGSTPLDSRTRITMLRCGNRILVVAQTATGLHPLSEITDPDEVRELTAACLGDSKHTFNSTLQSIEAEKTNSGFVDANVVTPSTRARSRGRLFATA